MRSGIPTSFAQNFEDIRLYRALKTQIPGWFVDVGTMHPDWLNCSRIFYDRGWRGINIEPIAEKAELIGSRRPLDITVQCCAGNSTETITLWQASSTDGRSDAAPGRSTTVAAAKEMLQAEGFQSRAVQVQQRLLSEILQTHASRFEGDFHFMKIDVELAENEVLAGMDFDRWRPWIVLCEGPPNFPLLEANGYEFAVYDQLNSWYVDKPHADLVELLSRQINIIDDGTWRFPRGHIGGQPSRAEIAWDRSPNARWAVRAARKIISSSTGRLKRQSAEST